MKTWLSVLISVLIICLGLSACATAPVGVMQAKEVPPERILAYGKPNPDYAKVVIIRDSGMLGGACYFSVMFRQTVLARFDAGEKATFYVPEGEWPMAVIRDPQGKGLCGINDLNPAVEKQKLTKEYDNLFRMSFGPYRRPRLLPQ